MPAEAEALVAELRARGVELRAVGDRLRYKPASALTPADVEVLRKHKEAVIALLRRSAQPWVDLSPGAVREALGAEPDEHDVAMLRFDVVVAVRQLEAEITSDIIRSRPLLVRGRPLGDWLALDDVARLLRLWTERPQP